MRLFTSVRARVTLGAVGVFVLALVLVGYGILHLVGATLVTDAQRLAEVQARNLAIVAELGRLSPNLDVDSQGTVVLQVVDDQGAIEAASHQLRNMPSIMTTLPAPGDVRASTVRLEPHGFPSGNYRVVGVGTHSPSGPIVVLAGVSLEHVDTTLGTLGRSLAAGFAVVLAVVGVIVWTVVTKALRPVERIRSEVERITEADLQRRVPTGPRRDEIHRLAATMNGMLDRLQSSSERQRAFIADASHELRSPLASLRTQLEVTAAHPRGADVQEVATDALADVTRLQDLTEDLLLLTRLDATSTAPRETFDATALIEGLLRERHHNPVPVTFTADGPAWVHAHPGHVERLVTNLVDNAVRHASTTVEVTCRLDHDVQIRVADDGRGIPAANHDRVFGRFVRLDHPRSRSDGGTGLGLSIARDIARTHGGDLTIEDSSVGALFVCTLPSAPQPPA